MAQRTEVQESWKEKIRAVLENIGDMDYTRLGYRLAYHACTLSDSLLLKRGIRDVLQYVSQVNFQLDIAGLPHVLSPERVTLLSSYTDWDEVPPCYFHELEQAVLRMHHSFL